jgi:N-carbamoylputrescine amidase
LNLRVALVSLAPVYGDISRNLSVVEGCVRRLSLFGVRLVCFPEMNLTGYSRRDEITSLAQPENGFAAQQLQAIARACDTAVVAGLPCKQESQTHPTISQFFCAPDGTCAVYHKTHLSQREQGIFSAGQSLGLVGWQGIRFGIQLCYDTHFPELSLAQASCGAQVLLMSFASPMGTPEALRERWMRFLSARAYDSGCYVLACNQAGTSPEGKTFPSVILALDPHGELIGEWVSADPGEVIADLDLSLVEAARRKRRFLQQRRPELYQFNTAG